MERVNAGDYVKIINKNHPFVDVTIGKTYRVTHSDNSGFYISDDSKDEVQVYWYYGNYKGVVKVEREFTKDDLEFGMLVEIRGEGIKGSKLYIVSNSLNGLSINDKYGEYMLLEKYQDDLKLYNNEINYLDIVKVYGLKDCGYSANLIDIKDRKLLWERKNEVPEYTMEELTNKLGHNFKIKK